MRRVIILAAVTALTVARPDVYKEKEDFKYSRSSSDDGTKSGYYGAQRGNMGGNYERAHNMDSLAQNQMSGLVNQVDADLGEGAKTNTGSVYTSANSRGVYGSGRHHDLSNLAGRNFQEGASFDNSQSGSSLSQSSSAFNNAAYTNSRSHSSRYGGYQATGQTAQSYQAGDLQALANGQSATGSHDYGQQSSLGYHSQSGYNSRSSYGSSDALSGSNDGSNVRTKFISAVPVRIVFRPGTRVAVPIGTQTYDINQGSAVSDANQGSSYDARQRSTSYNNNQRSSSYEQSSVNSEAEALSGTHHNNAYKPANDGKHYESSYSYRKEWERHNTIPPTLSTATDNPLPQNSELYEDRQSRASNHQYEGIATGSQTAHASNAYTGYNTNVKSSSGQSRYLANSNSQQHQLTSGSNLNAYTQAGYHTGSNGDLNSQVENINSQKPKSYQSSYSYHKSWERQGDPYVIKPASNGYYDGQRLSAGTKTAYGSGSHHQSQVDCDELCGHLRVARSYNTAQYQQDLGQQTQNLADFGQQSQNLEHFGQQSQKLEDFGQQSQKLEDFGQQSQKIEDFGQQLANFGQKTQSQDDLGQQIQSKWDKLEDLGQQTQKKWDKYEDLGQQVQNKWDQHTWETADDVGQHTRHHPGQFSQDIWNNQDTKPQKDDQRAQNTWDLSNVADQQITQHQKQDIHNIHAPSDEWNQQQFNQPGSFSQSPQNENDDKHKHKVLTVWDKLNTGTLQNSNDNAQTVQEQSSTQYLQNNNDRQDMQSTYGYDWNVDSTDTAASNTRTDSHKFTTNYETYSQNFQSHSQHNSALFNLWNKLDTIEKQLEASANKSRDVKYNSSSEYTSAQSSKQTTMHEHTYYGATLVNTTNSYENEKKNKTFNLNHGESSEKNYETRPQDVGRGDIGPEDLSAKSEKDVTEKTHKSLSNIDKNPLIPVINAVVNSSNEIIGKDSTDQEKIESYDGNPLYVPNAPTPMSNNYNNAKHDDSLSENNQRLEVLGKELKSLNQHVDSLVHKPEGSQNFEGNGKNYALGIQNKQQQNDQVHQNSQDYGQTNDKSDQQNLQDFGQQNENLEQQNSQDFWHADENLDQQNLQDFGQQNVNLEQQNVQDFGKPNENLDQQNLQDFGQQNENLEQQNLQDFEKPNENLDQENLQDFDQQNENSEQQNVQDFGKPYEDLNQQNLQDFVPQNENLDQQNLQDFEKPNENLDQQNLQDFVPQNENLEQQNLQDFEKPNENLNQQNLQDFGQLNENLELQNSQDLGAPNDNPDQQNLKDFGQQNENLEQQNSQDFWHTNENLEQQNLQDFTQQNVKLDQQNIQDFGNQNDMLEQQNVHDYGQHNTNLDQQNIHEFRRDNKNSEHEYGAGQGRENYNRHVFHELQQGNLEEQQTNNREPLENNGQVQAIWKPHPEKMEVVPVVDTTQHVNLQGTPHRIETPPEPTTEKPGFWKSVGNKFVNAKDKVFSWFGS